MTSIRKTVTVKQWDIDIDRNLLFTIKVIITLSRFTNELIKLAEKDEYLALIGLDDKKLTEIEIELRLKTFQCWETLQTIHLENS